MKIGQANQGVHTQRKCKLEYMMQFYLNTEISYKSLEQWQTDGIHDFGTDCANSEENAWN